MAEGVNVRVSGQLKDYVKTQVTPTGLYESASEYIRNLIRKDYEKSEQSKWNSLIGELTPGLQAEESKFIEVSAKDVIKRCKKQKNKKS